MEQENLIIRYVAEIDRLTKEVAEHWKDVQKCVTNNNLNDAITFLHRYFSLKEQLTGVEARLEGLLKGHFSDK